MRLQSQDTEFVLPRQDVDGNSHIAIVLSVSASMLTIWQGLAKLGLLDAIFRCLTVFVSDGLHRARHEL